MAIEVAEGISGSLQETGLTDLLRILAWNSRSGMLLVWDGPRQIGLCFDQGRVARTMTTEPLDEPIEAALLRGGYVNRAQIDEARAVIRLGRGRVWRVLRLLAADGRLDETGLVDAQAAAIRAVIRRTLPWTDGQMQFKPNIPPLPRWGVASLNVEEALIDGLREIDENGRAQATLDSVVRWAPSPPPGLTAKMVGHERWQALSACNGQRTLREVADSLGRESAMLVQQIQWLLDHGAVLLAPSPPPPPRAGEPAEEAGLPMEDRIVLLLSLFETSWPNGRANRGKAAAALTRMVNAACQLYLDYWAEIVTAEARERVWQTLVFGDLEEVVRDAELPPLLVPTPDRSLLRDGVLIPKGVVGTIQAIAEREPAVVLHSLVRLVERTLLLAVAEVERPVAQVDSFESANVFFGELNNRLAELV